MRLFVLNINAYEACVADTHLSVFLVCPREIGAEQRQRQHRRKMAFFVCPLKPFHGPIFIFLNSPHMVESAYTITLKLNSCTSIHGSTHSPPTPFSEPRTGYADVLGCASILLDIDLASFPQVYWQGFSTDRNTVLKPSTIQSATDNSALKCWDSPVFPV